MVRWTKKFPDIGDVFDELLNTDIIIDTEKLTPEEAANIIVSNVKKKMLI